MEKASLKKEKREVQSGLDVLISREAKSLKGKRFGLLAHGASVTSDLRYAWDSLASLSGVSLRVLFSPEHGLMGTHQDQEEVISDQPGPVQGLPVHSLYGENPDSLRPSAGLLDDLDVLLADLQDVGSRYYTYLYTLAYCMDVCRERDVEVWVLDRPNPIGGLQMEGNLVPPDYQSFVGSYPLPVRHGMTIGECARLINDFFQDPCRLRVVPMEGWRRGMWFDQTGLPWVMPSPNMPFPDTAVVYPGICLLEGTNLSEGRGTTRPFEIVGAPWIEPRIFSQSLNAIGLPGVVFRPLLFRPTFQKHAGETCGGVQIHVQDRNRFLPFLTGVHLILCAGRLWPGSFAWRQEPYEFESKRLAIDLLAGGAWLRDLSNGKGELSSFQAEWTGQIREFEKKRKKCLLY